MIHAAEMFHLRYLARLPQGMAVLNNRGRVGATSDQGKVGLSTEVDDFPSILLPAYEK
jgi:hypothetical protein